MSTTASLLALAKSIYFKILIATNGDVATFRPQVLTRHVATDILVRTIPDISTALVMRKLLEHLFKLEVTKQGLTETKKVPLS